MCNNIRDNDKNLPVSDKQIMKKKTSQHLKRGWPQVQGMGAGSTGGRGGQQLAGDSEGVGGIKIFGAIYVILALKRVPKSINFAKV